jgi:cation transport regulator
MPYDTVEELPEKVKNVLPKQAQEIYKEAYNSAWDHYEDPQDRRDDSITGGDSHTRLHGQLSKMSMRKKMASGR